MGRSTIGGLSIRERATQDERNEVKDGIIYVRDNHRRYPAREVLSALQLELSPGDTVSLNEMCQIIEDYAEKFSFNPEWPEEEEVK